MFNKIRISFLVLVLLVFSCSKDSLENEVIATSNSAIESEIISLINLHRVSIGKNTLLQSSIAQQYASEHTIYMIEKGEINHNDFPYRAQRISEKTNAKYVSENVARNYTSANEAIINWLLSDGHKQNIEGDYTHTGISVMKKPEGNYYFTQLFYK
tara:strand:+ start:8464 stop:8931 length:468 start_codon:yes stop_codon:yes gene_type:complete